MSVLDDIDWGTVGGAGAIAVGAKLIKSMLNAKKLQTYTDVVNSGLPSGYQINTPKQRFLMGDPAAYQKAIDTLATRNYDQYTSDYYADNAGLEHGPLAAVKDMYNTEVGPVRVEEGKTKVKGAYAKKDAEGLPKLLNFIQTVSGGGPGLGDDVASVTPTSQQVTVGPNEPMLEEDPTLSRKLTAGAQTSSYQNLPELPEFISPEMLKQAMSYNNTQRGQNVTMRGQDLQRQTAQERITEQKRYHDAQIKNALSKLGIDRERVRLYAKSIAQRSGRAPTKVEIAQQMLKTGEINKTQFRDFILKVPDMNLLGSLMGDTGDDASGASSGAMPSFQEWDNSGDE